MVGLRELVNSLRAIWELSDQDWEIIHDIRETPRLPYAPVSDPVLLDVEPPKTPTERAEVLSKQAGNHWDAYMDTKDPP